LRGGAEGAPVTNAVGGGQALWRTRAVSAPRSSTASSLRTPEECYRFFEDLCTVGELHALAQRLEVARMLREGRTYEEIGARTGMSSATISRIKRFLQYGADGYRLVLERLDAQG
jgi:TrpR-related protein YerC/YecD